MDLLEDGTSGQASTLVPEVTSSYPVERLRSIYASKISLNFGDSNSCRPIFKFSAQPHEPCLLLQFFIQRQNLKPSNHEAILPTK